MSYVPATNKERLEMLQAIGKSSTEQLFDMVPKNLRMTRELNIQDGLTELEIIELFSGLASKNTIFKTILRGAGAYRHFIPSAVKHLAGRSEFLTAYTPYQPELSQGNLQGIFEYQSMICALTGMDASNASVYDGATAAAEAMNMCKEKKLTKAVVSATVKPQNLEVMKTYARALDMELVVVPEKNGVTDLDALAACIDATTACVYTEQPNYYGILEPSAKIAEVTHQTKAKYIMGTYPTSLGLIKSPGEVGADIAVGEAQPLGIPLAFGGPYLGYMAAKKEMMRKLPGRIVGETKDASGKRAFVMTLQAREQHIRREKASSSICSNQALCALMATIYLSALGPVGLKEVATQCMQKARYLADGLCSIEGFTLKYTAQFFNEFVITSELDAKTILSALEEKGILGGYALSEHEILWCATEANTKAELDQTIAILTQLSRR